VGAVPFRVLPLPLTVNVVTMFPNFTEQICPSVGDPGRFRVRVACVLPGLYRLSDTVVEAVTVPVHA